MGDTCVAFNRVCPTRVMAISSVPDLSDACTSIPRRGSSATTPDGVRNKAWRGLPAPLGDEARRHVIEHRLHREVHVAHCEQGLLVGDSLDELRLRHSRTAALSRAFSIRRSPVRSPAHAATPGKAPLRRIVTRFREPPKPTAQRACNSTENTRSSPLNRITGLESVPKFADAGHHYLNIRVSRFFVSQQTELLPGSMFQIQFCRVDRNSGHPLSLFHPCSRSAMFLYFSTPALSSHRTLKYM